MNKNRVNALKNAGLDADQYFSLRLSKEYIPDGAEVVIQIRDQNTGELRSVHLNTVLDGCFAPNSRFYQQTMADGHTFNPYIHRRFLHTNPLFRPTDEFIFQPLGLISISTGVFQWERSCDTFPFIPRQLLTYVYISFRLFQTIDVRRRRIINSKTVINI